MAGVAHGSAGRGTGPRHAAATARNPGAERAGRRCDDPCCTASRPVGAVAVERPDLQPARQCRQSSMIDVGGAEFLMGTHDGEGYAGDGEGPRRRVRCGRFRIAACAVSNADFSRFVEDTGYVTDAEKYRWSFVFHQFVRAELKAGPVDVPPDAPWWIKVEGACWSRPEGPGSNLDGRMDHPVTHVSWFDAEAYCRWSGSRLPTEAEWECAARGGLEGRRFAWGDDLLPAGRHRCNIWQGRFPEVNTGEDGYVGTAPVTAFEPNGFGLYNACGNVWEWCADWFSPNYHRVTRADDPVYLVPSGRRSMRGGSYLCHDSYCNRYRVAARTSNTPDSSTGHCGFRVAADLL